MGEGGGVPCAFSTGLFYEPFQGSGPSFPAPRWQLTVVRGEPFSPLNLPGAAGQLRPLRPCCELGVSGKAVIRL
jgi:hypothetical protein